MITIAGMMIWLIKIASWISDNSGKISFFSTAFLVFGLGGFTVGGIEFYLQRYKKTDAQKECYLKWLETTGAILSAIILVLFLTWRSSLVVHFALIYTMAVTLVAILDNNNSKNRVLGICGIVLAITSLLLNDTHVLAIWVALIGMGIGMTLSNTLTRHRIIIK